MPTPSLSRDEQLTRLLALFRKQGYDATSIADVARATGLGKSSLYHHFPGGKEEMALAVLAHLEALLAPVLAAAHAPGPAASRLEGVLVALDAFYEGGRLACLLERLGASVEHARFAAPRRQIFVELGRAFEAIARAACAADPVGQAEDALVRLEGSFVVAAGTGDPLVFGRALARIKATLLGKLC